MGRKATISKDQIHQAARDLEDTGRKVTVSNVREIVGSGSYSTISTFLQEYQEAKSTNDRPAPEMPDSVRVATERLWTEVYQVAIESLEIAHEGVVKA